jgi:heat-inducible transcriptional repressor
VIWKLGLGVFAPHVSAGRLPTELGLRFFVDAFMEVGAIPPEARAALDDKPRARNGKKVRLKTR